MTTDSHLSRTAYMLVLWCLITGSTCQATAFAGESDLPTLDGPVVLLFDDDPLGGAADGQFGIFYDNSLPSTSVRLEESHLKFDIKHRTSPCGMLAVMYHVRGPGTYGGWWLKTRNSDWTAYRDGEVVLLLRRLDGAADQYKRKITLDTPETECLRWIKVELKEDIGAGTISTVGRPQRITDDMLTQQAKRGFFELRIPLKDFSLKLKRLTEMTLVIEHHRLPQTQLQSAFTIRGVLLTSHVGQSIDDILPKPTDNE